MAPRLSGQNSIFGVVFFVSKSLLGIERQKKLEKFAILTRKPRSHARILIYRTWPISHQKQQMHSSCNYNFECNWLLELSNNNLASELVEYRSWSNHNQGNTYFWLLLLPPKKLRPESPKKTRVDLNKLVHVLRKKTNMDGLLQSQQRSPDWSPSTSRKNTIYNIVHNIFLFHIYRLF